MKKIYYLVIFILIVCSLFTVYRCMPAEDKFSSHADEGKYLEYSSLVCQKGPGIFPDLVSQYLKNKENWILPSPLRLGYIFIASGWIKLFGSAI